MGVIAAVAFGGVYRVADFVRSPGEYLPEELEAERTLVRRLFRLAPGGAYGISMHVSRARRLKG